MRRALTLGLALFAAVFTLAVLPSAALAVQYTLNIDNCGNGGCGTPAGTVTTTQSGINDVLVSVTLSSGERYADGGNAFSGAFVFNLIGNPSIVVTGLPTGFNLLGLGTAGDLKEDGFGNFDYAIVCSSCQGGQAGNPSGPLNFHVVGLSSVVTEASFVELSTVVSGQTQALFAVDIVGLTGNTGAVGATTSVPEPGTLALLGYGLVGLGACTLRRFRGLPEPVNRNETVSSRV